MSPAIYILLWILLALIPGFVARHRGYSFWAYYLHGLFPSFVTALITLGIALQNSSWKPVEDTNSETGGLPVNIIATSEEDLDGKNEPSMETKTRGMDANALETIAKLHELRKQGILTEEEFLQKKKQLLDRI
jgi:hypothetical protein